MSESAAHVQDLTIKEKHSKLYNIVNTESNAQCLIKLTSTGLHYHYLDTIYMNLATSFHIKCLHQLLATPTSSAS